jgi:acyl carrier protein
MRLQDVFARVFEEPAERFGDDSSQENVLNWTSLRHVTLLVEVENAYQILFTNAEMTTMRSFGDVRAVLARKGIDVA